MTAQVDAPTQQTETAGNWSVPILKDVLRRVRDRGNASSMSVHLATQIFDTIQHHKGVDQR